MVWKWLLLGRGKTEEQNGQRDELKGRDEMPLCVSFGTTPKVYCLISKVLNEKLINKKQEYYYYKHLLLC